jgi:hypothetical protein
MIWTWAGWLLLLIVSFAILEGWALATGRTTLSRSVWTWSRNWPMLPFVAGLVAGCLACHFWWEGGYCAPGTPTLGAIGLWAQALMGG